jgi:hypothetical protein
MIEKCLHLWNNENMIVKRVEMIFFLLHEIDNIPREFEQNEDGNDLDKRPIWNW